jgi:hypothetical protein
LAVPTRGRFGLRRHLRDVLMIATALVLAWGMVYYYAGVLLPIREKAPLGAWDVGGYQSDLYPRWLGARELLWHHRNPYSREMTEEIELGFYGRPIDAARRDKVDPEAFAYPAYVAFLLAPLLPLRFEVAKPVFTAILLLMTVATLPLWVRGMKLRLGWRATFLAFCAMMSSYTVVEGLRLGQITLLVSFLMAGSVAALSRGWHLLAGILLALALVKPQLCAFLLTLLVVWSVGEWSARKRFAIGFGIVAAMEFVGSELMLPGWFGFWRGAVVEYIHWHRGSLLTGMLGARIAPVVTGGLILVCGILFWGCRTEVVGSTRFNLAVVSALTATTIVLPNAGGGSFYNQILLVPVVAWLVTSGGALAKDGPARLTWIIASAGLAGEWILAFAVSFAAFALGYHFQNEATAFVGGPEVLMYILPLELALFVSSAALPSWRAQ